MIAVEKEEIRRIEAMISSLRTSDRNIDSLLTALESTGDLIIIGGAIRSALQKDYKLRDVDLIFKSSKKCNLDSIIQQKNISYKKNRFNGYKIFFNNLSFDLWTMEDHWGFKKKFYEKNVKNIQQTTLLNYDSLVYDYSNKVLYNDNYRSCKSERIIDIIGTDEYVKNNPSPYINIMRILKIQMETGYKLSERSYDYIKYYYNKCDNIINYLEKAYRYHYNKIDEKFSKYIRNFFLNKMY